MLYNRIKRTLRVLRGQRSDCTLEVTTVFPCVNSCRYCPQEEWRRAYKGKERLTYDEFRSILAKVPRHVRLDFSGFSEPFGNQESSRMIRLACESGYEVALYTTLVGLRESDLDVLEGLHIYPCAVHLPDEEYFTVKDRARWLERFRRFTERIPYDEAVYHLGTIPDDLRDAVAKIRQRPTYSRANNADPTTIAPLARRAGPIGCPTSNNTFRQNVMMPNGDVYLCCMDWSLRHKLGNLFEQPYESLHDGDAYRQVMRGMNDETVETICRYCERCGG